MTVVLTMKDQPPQDIMMVKNELKYHILELLHNY